MVLLPLLQIKPPKPGFVAGDAADGTLCLCSGAIPTPPAPRGSLPHVGGCGDRKREQEQHSGFYFWWGSAK